jgi:hypothetical protein
MVPVPCKSNRKDKELKKRYFTEFFFFIQNMRKIYPAVCYFGVVLLLSYVLIRFVKFIKWNRKMKKILSHFPGPKPHWFFGNALQVSSF